MERATSVAMQNGCPESRNFRSSLSMSDTSMPATASAVGSRARQEVIDILAGALLERLLWERITSASPGATPRMPPPSRRRLAVEGTVAGHE